MRAVRLRKRRAEDCPPYLFAFVAARATHRRSDISRARAARACIFYAPDLIFIHERSAALKGVQIYIGDGATVTRSFIRKRGTALIGHSPVRTQLTWCQKEVVPRAISRIADLKL